MAAAAAAAAAATDEAAAAPPTLGYADPGSGGGGAAGVRPTPLVVPNLIAVTVLFLPLHSGGPPIDSIINYARLLVRLRGQPGATETWEALITGPFLLAIPLAVWTFRLAVAPRPRPAERAIAWSVTLIALVMTLLCVAYCAWLGHRRFVLPIVMTLAVLGITATCLLILWSLRRAWPAALVAMTGAWGANATLATLVVVSHQTWRVGGVVAMLAVVAQIVVMIICARRWRAAAIAATPG